MPLKSTPEFSSYNITREETACKKKSCSITSVATIHKNYIYVATVSQLDFQFSTIRSTLQFQFIVIFNMIKVYYFVFEMKQ